VDLGSYWLTHLRTRPRTRAMRQFADWLTARVAEG
jgi:hypothetical protein